MVAAAVVAAILCGTALAQDAPTAGAPRQERPGRGMGVGGQITAIDGATITLQTFRGESAKVRVTQSTRFMKDREPAKMGDFKVGDMVMVGGELGQDGVWTAQMLRGRSGGPGGGGEGMGRGGMMRGPQMKPEDNGKSYILGVVTKIDGVKLTVKKPDSTEQVIEVGDDTSFRNASRESVTLADVKVGDFVRGQGAVKDGIFVPRELNAGRPRGMRTGTPSAANGAQQSQGQVAPETAAPGGGPMSDAPDSDDQKK